MASEISGLERARGGENRVPDLISRAPTHNTQARTMSTLAVIGYNELHKAEEVRLMLRKLQRDYLIDIEDAVVATKDSAGKIKLHQAVNLTAAGAVSGG